MTVLLIKGLSKKQKLSGGWCMYKCVRVLTGKTVFRAQGDTHKHRVKQGDLCASSLHSCSGLHSVSDEVMM